IITEAEFLARRESVERVMVVRERGDHTQIGVLEDGVLVEHYISGGGTAQGAAGAPGASMAGNVYLGRVQNVLPSMEAAFVDIGKGRNAVLYAGEVNWDAAGLEQHKSRRIENALSSGQSVLVQVTKDPIGHKGARLTSQVSLPGRYLVYVPDGSMTGISRKLPDTERARLKKILKDVVPDDAGVIVRTAAEGASEEELTADVARLRKAWDKIQSKAKSGNAPVLLHGEPDLTTRVVRDVFNEDFTKLVVAGPRAWETISDYVDSVAPDLADRLERWTGERDVFAHYRVDEQIAKAMDRKVWLPSGGSLVIDRTEAMTVVDVNTGKFTGSGGNLEETVTKNNIEAAEEIVRQLRLRDIGGIIVIDFIDMVLESNRELVVRRLLECLGRDRTKHQVAEVTSLGLVQMTRKRVGAGLIEVFSESCEHCNGRGVIVSTEPLDASKNSGGNDDSGRGRGRGRGSRGGKNSGGDGGQNNGNGNDGNAKDTPSGPTPAQIAAAAYAAAVQSHENDKDDAVEGDAPMESATAEALVEEHLSGESRDVPTSSEVAAGEDESPTGRVSGRVSGRVGGRRAATSEPTTPAGQTSPEGATEPASVEAPPAEEAPAPKRRRAGRRAASAPTAAPTGAEAAVFTVAETEPTEPSTPITMSAADAATDAAATQTPEPPKRRRAARRAAGSPAGPPRATD
ncbi:MAG: Rne/Rng family ribonuclease, partial [Mobilicoccus sp.]|nr:Rne/Rng family ribonuclease [Mobilicoccus sp.]